MASLTYYPNGQSVAVIIIMMLIFSLTFFPSFSVGSPFLRGSDEKGTKETKMVLGSRPPKCVNRCLNCKPCMAALVAPPHHKTTSSSKGDESYYLLAWKCKCGDKYFQP